MRYQEGIALVQVLIISFILALLGIFINQSVQQQVNITQQIKNRFAMRLALEEAETQLFTALLAYKKYPKNSGNDEIITKWNFYGEEFQVTDSTNVTLTDMKSLLSLNISDANLIKSLLEQLKIEPSHAQSFAASLSDWKDENDFNRINGAESAYYQQQGMSYRPRNGYLQSINEARLIKGAEHIPMEYLNTYFTTELVLGFNPLNSPEPILKAFVKDDNTVKKIMQRRKQGTLSSHGFYLLTGKEQGEYINFATSSKIRVQLRTTLNGAQLSKQYILDATPRSYTKPMVFYKVSWNKS